MKLFNFFSRKKKSNGNPMDEQIKAALHLEREKKIVKEIKKKYAEGKDSRIVEIVNDLALVLNLENGRPSQITEIGTTKKMGIITYSLENIACIKLYGNETIKKGDIVKLTDSYMTLYNLGNEKNLMNELLAPYASLDI
jgi:transcriptional antiterminator